MAERPSPGEQLAGGSVAVVQPTGRTQPSQVLSWDYCGLEETSIAGDVSFVYTREATLSLCHVAVQY